MNAIAVYDYNATENEELSIRKDERLTILDDSRSWWQVENSRRETGYVPSNYVRRANKGLFEKFKEKSKEKEKKSKEKDNPENGALSQPGEYFVPQDVLAALETVVAKFAFQPQHDDELALTKGDRIKVLEKQQDGWWKGRIGTKEGWFPSNYTQKEEKSVVKKPVIQKVRTLYNFEPENPEELKFKKDEILEVVDKPENDPDWWIARKEDGSSGLVPRNYIVILGNNGEIPASNPASLSPVATQMPKKVILPEHQKLPFSSEKWFWGKVTRGHAEKLLNKTASDGDFLVRVSETQVRGPKIISGDLFFLEVVSVVDVQCSCG